MFLDLRLIESVDDGVLPLRHEDLLHLALVVEADLSGDHAAVFLEIGPWRIDDGDVVLLVALDRIGLCQLR